VLALAACTSSPGSSTGAATVSPTFPPPAAAAARAKGTCATIPDLDPSQFPASPSVTNRYLPDIPGTQYVLSGTVTTGGHAYPHRIVSTITNLTKTVDGIQTVVIYEQDIQLGVVQESELLFAAQDLAGSVWHVGEYPEVFNKAGHLTGAPESWLSGVAGAEAGVDMPPTLHVGDVIMQGYSPTVKFWDCAKVQALHLHRCVPTGCYDNVVLTNEYSPTAPADGHQLKFSAPGFGTVLALPLHDPHPEVVHLVKATCLDPSALAAVDKATLAQDQRGYDVAQAVYAGSPPAEQTLSKSC
jgi:hypothetical protein